MAGGGIVGGPRHYEGLTLGAVTAWKCPSCGIDNTSVFEEGCPSCGAGSQKPRHVGVPPTSKRGSLTAPTPADIWTPKEWQPLTGEGAFAKWITTYPGVTVPVDPEIHTLLRAAWRAAIEWYRTTEPPPTTETDPIATVAVPKGLLDKVIAVLDATFDLPEEQQSEDLQRLIAQLKELRD